MELGLRVSARRKEVDKVAVPNRLKFLRERVNLTQKEVGRIVGVDETTVSKHENGDRALSDTMIREYAKLFKVETHELFINLNKEGEAVGDE